MPAGAKNWCFTLNNPDEPYVHAIRLTGDVNYAVWQQEHVSTHHLQGYVQFDRKITLGGVKLILPTAHWEVARGTFADNRTYCTKDESRVEGTNFYEIGVPTTQGQRSDLIVIQQQIKDGATDKELAEEHFAQWTRNYRAFGVYRNLIQEKRDWVTHVIVLTGPTDVGKSRYVKEHANNAFKQCNKNWFSFYQGEDEVIFDEFYGNRFSYSYFLMLLDRYDMRVETKGGEVNFKPRKIWITSNKNPWEWYPNMPQAPLMRRISYHREILEGESREDWNADVDDAIAFLNTE